jgi:AcrR family transcriptional regulator
MVDTLERAGPASRRERQAAERLEHILETAAALFAEHGYHRTTTKDIAQAADVSEGTLYNYFTNKNDLLFSILERLGEYELPSDWDASQLPDDARQFMGQILELRRAFVERNAVMLQAILSEILANSELRERYNDKMIAPTLLALEQSLQMRAQQGQIRPETDLPALTRLIVGMYLGLFLMQVLGDPVVTSEWDRLAQTFIGMLFDGIGP